MSDTVTPRLSVVMPCYNERATIEEIVDRVLANPHTAELVIVDDGSSDGTRDILAGFSDPRVKVFLAIKCRSTTKSRTSSQRPHPM